jgi:hypothetical protein
MWRCGSSALVFPRIMCGNFSFSSPRSPTSHPLLTPWLGHEVSLNYMEMDAEWHLLNTLDILYSIQRCLWQTQAQLDPESACRKQMQGIHVDIYTRQDPHNK